MRVTSRRGRPRSGTCASPIAIPQVIVQAQTEQDVVNAVTPCAGARAARQGARRRPRLERLVGALGDADRPLPPERDQLRSPTPASPACSRASRAGTSTDCSPSTTCSSRPATAPPSGIGGFLLQGGWGWNSRAIGPACMSVVAVDVVTAVGELIHADAEQNSDYWWAARGAGGGYFGVVTRFYLRCHPRPSATYTRTDVYSLDRHRGRLELGARVRADSAARVRVRDPRAPRRRCPTAARCTTEQR